MSTSQSSGLRPARRRRAAALALAAGIAAAPLTLAAPAQAASFGEIEDAGLAACINDKLGGGRPADQDITAADLYAVNWRLECGTQFRIETLTGLEGATRLTSLELFAGNLSATGSLDAISAFPNMTELRLDGLNITDASLAGVSGATGLTKLSLNSNPALTDISALSGMHALTQLTMQGNAITSLAPLADATEMTILGASNNAITSVAPLARLTKMDALTLSNNQITDLSGLEDMSVLTQLWVNENPLDGRISALANKPLLHSLNITRTGTRDFLPLAASTNLTTFQAAYNEIRSLEGLGAYTSGTHNVAEQAVAGPTLYVPVGASSIRFDVTGHTALRDGTTTAPLGGPIVPPADPEWPLVRMNLVDTTTRLQYTFRDAPSPNNVFAGTVTMPIVRADITSSDTASGEAKSPFSHTITVTDGFPATLYQLGDDAPAWLSIDPTTGVLSGTPPEPGVFTVSVLVSDALGNSIPGELTITIAEATDPPITPPIDPPVDPPVDPPTTAVKPPVTGGAPGKLATTGDSGAPIALSVGAAAALAGLLLLGRRRA